HSRNRLHLLVRAVTRWHRGVVLYHEIFSKRINLRKSLLFAVFFLVALTIASAIPQSETSASQPPLQGAGKIGPSAVWHSPQDFIAKAHAACDQGNPPNYAECFMAQMSEGGAPTDAVNFTRMLFHESDGQVGIMSEFHKVGPLDIARVVYP